MHRRAFCIFCYVAALVAAAAASGIFGWSQFGPAAAWGEELKPTAQHEVLRHEVGVWDVTSTIVLPDDMGTFTSRGVETNRLMADLWLISDYEEKSPFHTYHGHGTYGYDPHKKKYVGAWVDNMNVGLMTAEGDYDPEAKTLTLTGRSFDSRQNREVTHRQVTVYKSADEKHFTLYEVLENGEQRKMFEMVSKRRGDKADRNDNGGQGTPNKPANPEE